jgi:FkbH-like protein
MKLIEALRIAGSVRPGLPSRVVHLLCGYTPAHFETFFKAHLQQRTGTAVVETRPGLFDDLAGSIERAVEQRALEAVVVFEWADLDARLGWRSSGGWLPDSLQDIEQTVEHSLKRIEAGIGALANTGSVVAVSAPTLPLLPISFAPGWLISEFEARVRALVAGAVARIVSVRNVRFVNAQRLEMLSPLPERADVRAEIAIGFPYRQSHAAALANLLAETLSPPTPKKGLVTDLDDTLWRGILGDVGLDGISCSLESGAHVHALYQQLLASLAASGVLLAIASKNDPDLAALALQREDLLVRNDQFFPLQVHWQPKSQSMEAILGSWNVGADSVVFVDDSPMELAEVKARFPEVECLLFPKDDPVAVVAFISRLRDLFGKEHIHDEDRLRLDSLRAADVTRRMSDTAAMTIDDFLSGAQAEIDLEFSRESSDTRAFELVNKTNQFNLNGRRYSEPEWRSMLGEPDSFMLTATYSDKFGKLGKIAVLTGRLRGTEIQVQSWVMSCRAFSRRIEFQCLHALFEQFGASRLVFEFAATTRNGPVQDFFDMFMEKGNEASPFVLTRALFESRRPPLHHRIRTKTGVLSA